MKRKLINFDVFQRIEKDSLSMAERELHEAEDVLAKALAVDHLQLHCFGESDVTYATLDGTYIHAGYQLNESHVVFENVEELVIDEDTEKKTSKKMLNDFVESLLDNNEAKANDIFSEYMKLPSVRRNLKECAVNEEFKVTVSKPTGHSKLKGRPQSRSHVAKRIRNMKKTKAKLSSNKSLKNQLGLKKDRMKQRIGGSTNKRWRVYARKVNKSKLHEWAVLSENVLDYVDYQTLGPTLGQSAVQHDDRGNVVAVSVPRIHTRNEGKILNFNWKTLDHEIKYSRSGAKNLVKEASFCKAMAELKRFNAVSDNSGLETTLENIVARWPQLLYLTQTELSEMVSEALGAAGVSKYDDQICDFMADAVLRVAHHAYEDRAKKIVGISQLQPTVESKDSYDVFKDVVDRFYPSVDESSQVQYRVFADLYRALHEVYRNVDKEGDEAAKAEVASYMQDCESILNHQEEPSLELAETIAVWLQGITEANVDLAKDDWGVSNGVHTSVTGEHPDLARMATVPNIPGRFKGDWGSELPVSDGKNYRGNLDDEMRNSWANFGGNDTAPELTNPYTPKPFGDYKMKGEKSVVDDSNDFGSWQGSETWPNLKNPYLPKEDGGTGGSGYKMKSDNLVVDQ